MENEIKTRILTIAFLFTIILGAFSLLSRLSLVFTSSDLKKGLSMFFIRSSLWIIVVSGIILVLYRLIKKTNQGVYDMIGDSVIREATGILVTIDGLINLASSLPINFISIKSAFDVSKQLGLKAEGIIEKTTVTNLISLIIMLCQIIFGVFLARYYKNKNI